MIYFMDLFANIKDRAAVFGVYTQGVCVTRL